MAAQRDEVNHIWRAASHSLAGEASAQALSWKSMVISPLMLSFATIANITHLQWWFTSHIFYWLLTMWVWLTIQDSCPLWGPGTQSPILKAPHLDLTLYFHPIHGESHVICLTSVWEERGLNSFRVQNQDEDGGSQEPSQ